MKRWINIPLGYAVMALLTWAWIFDAPAPGTTMNEGDRVMLSFFGGVIWPLYWGGKTALSLVRAGKQVAAKENGVSCLDAEGNSWAPVNGVCRLPHR